jgi:hypothetical protein
MAQGESASLPPGSKSSSGCMPGYQDHLRAVLVSLVLITYCCSQHYCWTTSAASTPAITYNILVPRPLLIKSLLENHTPALHHLRQPVTVHYRHGFPNSYINMDNYPSNDFQNYDMSYQWDYGSAVSPRAVVSQYNEVSISDSGVSSDEDLTLPLASESSRQFLLKP